MNRHEKRNENRESIGRNVIEYEERTLKYFPSYNKAEEILKIIIINISRFSRVYTNETFHIFFSSLLLIRRYFFAVLRRRARRGWEAAKITVLISGRFSIVGFVPAVFSRRFIII